MSRFTVIVPSRNPVNLIACHRAIRDHEGNAARIIVVDDGLDDSASHVFEDPGVIRIPGVKPFIFARNINLGIVAAGTDDVILLNDDAKLETPGGFTTLARTADAHPECGVMSAATNCGAACQRQWPGGGVRYDNVMLAFVCVFIPRSTIERLGMLDERFGLKAEATAGPRGYGCDDDDYCWRVRETGLKLGICDAVHVDHLSLKSTFRHDPKRPANVMLHEALFKAKWGRHPRNP